MATLISQGTQIKECEKELYIAVPCLSVIWVINIEIQIQIQRSSSGRLTREGVNGDGRDSKGFLHYNCNIHEPFRLPRVIIHWVNMMRWTMITQKWIWKMRTKLNKCLYQTHVYTGSNLWVPVSVTQTPFGDLTDVTLLEFGSWRYQLNTIWCCN